MLPANQVVMEIKVNERIPSWLTGLIADHNLRAGAGQQILPQHRNCPEDACPALAQFTPGKRRRCPGFRPRGVPTCPEDDGCARR